MLRELDTTGARRALVRAARLDLRAAMALAVPFVLTNPDEASVLSELAAIAGPSSVSEDDDVFGVGIGELIRASTCGRRLTLCSCPVK